MITWILYDIAVDRARNKTAKYCKQAGLYRVQYSAFLGDLDAHQRDTLALQIGSEIDEAVDKVYILPMSKDELQNAVLLGQAFDKDYVTNEIKALFL